MTNNQDTITRIQMAEFASGDIKPSPAEVEELARRLLAADAELQERRKAAEPVGEDELEHLIWGLERYGLYPRQLAALKELRELRKTMLQKRGQNH